MPWRKLKMALSLIILIISFEVALCLNVTYDPSDAEVYVGGEANVTVTCHGEVAEILDLDWTVIAEPSDVLNAEYATSNIICSVKHCNMTLTVRGVFLGLGKVFLAKHLADGTEFRNEVRIETLNSASDLEETKRTPYWISKSLVPGVKTLKILNSSCRNCSRLEPALTVIVLRRETWVNHLFTAFVATVVTLNYINMGCALDISVVKSVLKKPTGPVIGFFCQFVMMPLVSYGVGYLVFTDPILRLGLFTFGSSPGGGASNMWTVLLGGNLNLSITMTFVSTIAALGTIPFWLFTLGKTILKETSIVIPFVNIVTSMVALVIPIGIGVLIQWRFPKMAARSKRILAPVCIILLISIIILASLANTYMFYMLTWRMIIAASLSVWVGFAVGAIVALVFRFPSTDIIAIAVETGIQNSGIAFVLLTYSLHHPESDLAAVVPVAGSLITPIPLFIVYCCQSFRNRWFRSEEFELKAINPIKGAKGTPEGMDNKGMYE